MSTKSSKECSKQWDTLALLLASEEKRIERRTEGEIDSMTYFNNLEGMRNVLDDWLSDMKRSYAKKSSETYTAQKCNEVSCLWRRFGNNRYLDGFYEESYYHYCKSVIFAPQDGPMYALALANRSAALLKMKRFQESFSDIILALQSEYPRELRYKLLLRQADCYIEMRQHSKSEAALASAKTHASTLKPSDASIFQRQIQSVEKKLASPLYRSKQPIEEVILPDLHLGENPNFRAASNALEIQRNDTVGRYVVTKEIVNRGDILFSEEPYAWVAFDLDIPLCEMCCEKDINPVPCSGCSRSLYCSEKCRVQAAATFHKYECAGSQSELLSSIGIAHLALRVLLTGAERGFPQLASGVPIPVTAADLFRGYSNVDNIEIYKKNTHPFYSMFNLVTNFDKMVNVDYIQYAVTASMLTLYLENYTDFFDHLPSKVPYALSKSELKLFASAVILRSLGQLICNGHVTTCLVSDTGSHGSTGTEKEMRRATAIYPTASMMNHSCDPNIINNFYKKRLIICASRELPLGAEVLNCYGPHYARQRTAQRKLELRSQYMFNCTCTACRDTGRVDFFLLFNAYACQNCKGPVVWCKRETRCSQCNALFDLSKANEFLDRAADLMRQAECAATPEEKCELAHKSFRLKQQAWHRHHSFLRTYADKLAEIYAEARQFTKSIELIKQNVQSLEYQYGSFSVEVALELNKLCNVMLDRIATSSNHPDYQEWNVELLKIARKALQLLTLNYGSWHSCVRRVRQLENILKAYLEEAQTLELEKLQNGLQNL